MDKFFDVSVSIPMLLLRLACATLLGAVIAWRPLSRRPMKTEVRHALLMMTVASTMVIVVIGDSMARAFGVVGLGSFIRFRSSIKDPRDVVLFFLAIGTGMACGLGAVPVAATGVGAVWVLLVILDRHTAPELLPNPAWDEETAVGTPVPGPVEVHS